LGCVASARAEVHRQRTGARAHARDLAQSRSLTPGEADQQGIVMRQDGRRRTAFELLSFPHVHWADLVRVWPDLGAVPADIAEQVETDAKYAVYLDRQANDVAAYRRDETLELPAGLDYGEIPGLSTELRQKLDSIRPRTIGQAGRVDGMTPVALTLLAARIRPRRRTQARAPRAPQAR
jgi:tRNA uridine 5-carboxymethylaminomethyl modification enzyme